MRVVLLCLALALAVAACGPSSSQIRTAKAAEYTAPGKQILDIAMQVAQQKYKLGALDIDGLRFATAPQFYTAEGGRISPTNEFTGDFVNAKGGDVQLTLIVQVVELGAGRVAVTVTPKTLQVVSGSPQPRELKPDDPNLPPWIHGRVDTLAVAIYEQAKAYRAEAAAAASASAPAPAAAPAAAPAGEPAAPATEPAAPATEPSTPAPAADPAAPAP